MGSPKYTVDLADVLSGLRGLFYTLAPAAAVYIAEWTGHLDKSNPNNIVWIVAGSFIANLIKNFVVDNTNK